MRLVRRRQWPIQRHKASLFLLAIVGGGVSISYGVSVGSGGSVSQASAATVVFASDWGTLADTTATATTDGGVWDGEQCSSFRPFHGAVVPVGDSLTGFPTTNVVRFELFPDNSTCYQVTLAPGSWSPPAVGECQFHRVYAMAKGPNTRSFGNQHFWHLGSDGLQDYEAWGIFDGTISSQQLTYMWDYNVHDNDMEGDGDLLVRFNTFTMETVYIFVLRQCRTGTNESNLTPQVYNSSGTILVDSTEFVTEPSGQNPWSWAVAVASPSDHFTGIELGWNGSDVTCVDDECATYFGAYIVWQGGTWTDHLTYTPGEGPS